MPVENTINRAKAELAKSRLWRAKEILQGAINTYGYNTELYETYGIVLLKMGDLIEAGKYLFLSGKRNQEYIEAIDLYKYKYFRDSYGPSIIISFPKKARKFKLSDYPDNVKRDLEKYSLPKRIKIGKGTAKFDDGSFSSGCGWGALISIIILLTIVAIVTMGFIKGCEMVDYYL
jgi:tetratricopeptide (TPR) repeat protein